MAKDNDLYRRQFPCLAQLGKESFPFQLTKIKMDKERYCKAAQFLIVKVQTVALH